jgi:uncharacterized RDD family membrane protein YckC
MHCKHCGFGNGEGDHRCLRCGRRLQGAVFAAPGFSGANALAMARQPLNDTLNETRSDDRREFPPVASAPPSQTVMFAGPSKNVIPFDPLRRQTTPPQSTPEPAAPKPVHAARRSSVLRKPAAPPVDQGTLDFIPTPPAKSRRLKTDVDAQIFCDQPVATPMHRCVASMIDAALIFTGFTVLVVTFEGLGGSFGAGKNLWIGLGAVFALVSMFYGLIWAIAGRETVGMRFTDLQLITFDGFPLDGRSRALRFVSTCLSFCSGGLGVLWAVADEESLTWHDHISKTFPTIREEPRSFVKARR